MLLVTGRPRRCLLRSCLQGPPIHHNSGRHSASASRYRSAPSADRPWIAFGWHSPTTTVRSARPRRARPNAQIPIAPAALLGAHLPAGSSLGGFRTPAPVRAAVVEKGRHPEPFTSSTDSRCPRMVRLYPEQPTELCSAEIRRSVPISAMAAKSCRANRQQWANYPGALLENVRVAPEKLLTRLDGARGSRLVVGSKR